MGKQKNELIIEDKEYDIPFESITFLKPYNYDYITILKAKMRSVDGEPKEFYKAQVDCARLVEHIVNKDELEKKLDFIFVKDSLLGSVFIYVYENGVYKVVNEDEFKGYLKENIPSPIRKVKDINEVYQLLLMENSLYVENNELNSNYNYINFKNGLLNLNTMEMEEHTPDLFFTVQIPVEYKSLDECEYGKVFEKYMDELTSGDKVMKKAILEAMGLVMSNIPGYLTKKCILMIGAKDCGKTQIKKLLTELIGIRYTSSMDLDKMNDSRFGTSELYNKRLAGSNDMRYTTINDMGIFKQLTGGDPISIEFKGRGAFSYIYNGFIWFLANDFPMFSGKKGKEIYERFMIIPCNHVVEKSKQDPELVRKMLQEKEYIVSLCINNLLDLIKRNYKFIESNDMKAAMDKYEVSNNSLLQFVDECCEINNNLSRNEKIKLTQFRRYYQRWCNDAGVKPMKLSKEETEYYLGPKYGTEVRKSGDRLVSNIVMNDNFKEEYMNFGN